MDSFIGIRFKKETAKRFQTFSRTYFKSHTEAMATMLDFFFYNEISPKEKLGPTGRTIEAKLAQKNQCGYCHNARRGKDTNQTYGGDDSIAF